MFYKSLQITQKLTCIKHEDLPSTPCSHVLLAASDQIEIYGLCVGFVYSFLILMGYFFKKIKNLWLFSFEKITCCAKREKKITCHEEKSQPPPPLDIKWSVPNIE